MKYEKEKIINFSKTRQEILGITPENDNRHFDLDLMSSKDPMSPDKYNFIFNQYSSLKS